MLQLLDRPILCKHLLSILKKQQIMLQTKNKEILPVDTALYHEASAKLNNSEKMLYIISQKVYHLKVHYIMKHLLY